MIGRKAPIQLGERSNGQRAEGIAKDVDRDDKRCEVLIVDRKSAITSGMPGANIEDARGLEPVSLALAVVYHLDRAAAFVEGHWISSDRPKDEGVHVRNKGDSRYSCNVAPL